MGIDKYLGGCENPYEHIDEQIRDAVTGPIATQKSDRGTTYYVGMVKRGRTFATVQPNIWLYVDPSVRKGIDATHPPRAVTQADVFQQVPDNEKWRSSFGHRMKVDTGTDCELSDEELSAIRQSYAQVKRSVLR